MQHDGGSADMSFTSLLEYRAVGPQVRVVRGNVIKAALAHVQGKERVGILEPENEQPLVVIHRDGEIISGAEFICSCGRRAMLDFEYEDK